MNYNFPGFSIAYFLAAFLSLVTAAMTWRRKANPGSSTFTLLMLSLFAWSFASIFEAAATIVNDKLFWSKWQYIGIASLLPLWLLFAADFTHQKLMSKSTRILLWVIPVITLGLAFTNEYHGLLWSEITILPGPLQIAKYDHGPWFFVHTGYSYLMLLVGTLWLAQALLKNPRKKRKQILIIFLGVAVSWLSNVLYVFGWFPVPGLDPTPLSFTFIAIMFSWSIFQFQLFDIVPIARDRLLDNMSDGVIVLDKEDIIVDINPAALKILDDNDKPSPIGQSVWEAYHDYSHVIEKFRNSEDVFAEVQLRDVPPLFISLNISTIFEKGKKNVGQVLTVRDITSRKLIELKEIEQRELAEALADTAAVINSSLELDEVLKRILENVGRVVPHEAADISLVDFDGNVSFVKTMGYEKFGTEKYIKAIEFKVDEIANLKQMAQSGKGLLIADTNADPGWDRSIVGSAWIRSNLSSPMKSKGQLLGFISLNAATPNFFREEQIDRLQAFADQAAIAVENAQLFHEVAYNANELKILYEIGLSATSGLEFEKTSRAIFGQLKRVAPIDLFYIARLDSQTDLASFSMFEGDGTPLEFGPLSIRERPSLTRYVLEKGKTVYIRDCHAPDAEYPEEKMIKVAEHNERSILGVPLILRNQVLGAMFLQSREDNQYDENFIRLVETIANQVSIAMENAQLFEQMQQMAITDNLTGVTNRNYFYTFGENEVARSQRYEKDLSFMMVDIDHYKLINDEYGHLTGDQTLKMVTQACLSKLRKADVLCRFGGDEFVVVLPETSRAQAKVVAERVRKAVEEIRLPTEKGEVKVTVSIGVVQLENKQDGLLDLVGQADQALYAAKAAGRNCVRVYKP